MPGTDLGPPADGSAACARDSDCDNGVFCDGTERCRPGEAGADARGCVAASTPACPSGAACLEDADRCQTRCDVDPDADGDGVDAVECGGADCDDADARVYAGATEVCDPAGLDEDCNPSTLGGRDMDGDGAVDAACCNGSACGTDCDDFRADVRPGATEVCNGRDDDCDGRVDDGVLLDVYVDNDRDGYGDPARAGQACPGTAGFAVMGGDCDDVDPARNPGQVEVCDGKDNDCDTLVDDGTVEVPWYRDADGDGFGNARGGIIVSCTPPAGHVLLATDCDDTNPAVSPRAAERCNGRDDDCNGRADYVIAPGDGEDDDVDGYADPACGTSSPDCDDLSPWSNPGRAEICDMRDNDCNGLVDDGAEAVRWYRDADRDGFGASGDEGILSCTPVPGRTPVPGDCDDTDPRISPAMADDCTGRAGVDDDCDGVIDNSTTPVGVFADADGDGWGTGTPMLVCGATTLPRRAGDCNDTNPAINPGATQSCALTTTTDEDCDGLIGCEDPDCATASVCMINFRLRILNGEGQTARAGEALVEPVVVRVETLAGAPAPGRNVTLSSGSGGTGAVRATLTSDGAGIVSFDVVAGLRLGADTLRLTSPGALTLTTTLTITDIDAGAIHTVLNGSRAAGSVATSGVPGPSVLARPSSVGDIAVASDGTVFVSDPGLHCVYRIDAAGRATVFAGTCGTSGATGDFVDPTTATLRSPTGLALDETRRRLYIADRGNRMIRYVDLATNVIRNFVGGGSAGAPGYGDGSSGSSVALQDVAKIALAGDGRLVLADRSIPRLRIADPTTRRVDAWVNSAATCSAASGAFAGCGSSDCAMVVDGRGDTYVQAQVNTPEAGCVQGILRVRPDGTATGILGASTASPPLIEGQSARGASFGTGGPIALDAAGNLYFAESARHVVWRIDGATGRVSRVAGTVGTSGASGDFGPATAARLNTPSVLAMRTASDLLVGSGTSFDVRRVTSVARSAPTRVDLAIASGSMQTALLGAPLSSVLQVRTTSGGSPVSGLVVTYSAEDEGLHLANDVLTTLTDGTATTTGRVGLAPATYRALARAFDLRGDEVTGSPATFTLTASAPAPGTIFTAVNASRTSGFSGIPGPGPEARVNGVWGVALASDGTVYLSGVYNHRVYRLSPRGQLSVLAGDGNPGFSGDGGPAGVARIHSPAGLALDERRRRLFVADRGNNRVRMIDLSLDPPVISTYAGGGSAGAPGYGDGGLATNAQLRSPRHLAVASDGTLYVAEPGSANQIRAIEPTMRFIDTVLRGEVSVCSGTDLRFYDCGDSTHGCALAVDATDALLVAANWRGTTVNTSGCTRTPAVFRLERSGGRTHLAGYAGGATASGGAATATLFAAITGLALADGRLVVAEGEAHRVRTIAVSTGVVADLAGTGTAGNTGDFGPGISARVNEPICVAAGSGHVYFGSAVASDLRVVW
jgi:hypothetical protein